MNAGAVHLIFGLREGALIRKRCSLARDAHSNKILLLAIVGQEILEHENEQNSTCCSCRIHWMYVPKLSTAKILMQELNE